jgi:hypothetical protein
VRDSRRLRRPLCRRRELLWAFCFECVCIPALSCRETLNSKRCCLFRSNFRFKYTGQAFYNVRSSSSSGDRLVHARPPHDQAASRRGFFAHFRVRLGRAGWRGSTAALWMAAMAPEKGWNGAGNLARGEFSGGKLGI